MAFCSVCGNETKVEVIVCPSCNASQVDYKYKIVKLKEEKIAWVWLALGFIIPIFGFLAFIFLGHDRPKTSLYTLIGTVAGSVALFTMSMIMVVSVYGIY